LQVVEESTADFLKVLKRANSVIPHVVLGSTILALVYPPSFTWFTTRSVLHVFVVFCYGSAVEIAAF
jgi:hypothetical protein